jgi:hypothetical protein
MQEAFAQNVRDHRCRRQNTHYQEVAAPRLRCIALCTPGTGVMLWGASPLYEIGNFSVTVYQMFHDESQVRDEGNCGEATDRGEEACDRVRKRRVCLSPPGRDHVKTARLRTETSYKAGAAGRASTTSRSRYQSAVQVNGELAQRNITLLSGETCQTAREPSFAPVSKACLKGGNIAEQSAVGEAGVSRGHSTELPSPTETGRTER